MMLYRRRGSTFASKSCKTYKKEAQVQWSPWLQGNNDATDLSGACPNIYITVLSAPGHLCKLKEILQHPRVPQASHPHSTTSKHNYPRKDIPLQSTVSNPVSSTQQPIAQPQPTTTSPPASNTQQPNAQPQPTTTSHSSSSTQ